MVNSSDFTKRLEKILEYYSLSAAAFAEEIDFNRSTISHLLSGRNKPSLEFVMKLYQKFPEIDLDWLLFDKGNFPSTSNNDLVKSKKEKAVIEEKQKMDLFSKDYTSDIPDSIRTNKSGKEIERIVIFYTDGSFNFYEN